MKTRVVDEPDTPDDVAQIRYRMRQFGYDPKCWAFTGPTKWLMVYENTCAPMSKRFFVGVFEGITELYRHIYRSDTAAREDFEKRVERETVAA